MRKISTVASSTSDWPRKSEGDTIELNDGRLLIAYMEFCGEGSDVARTRIAARESTDGGLTWDAHRILAETAPGDINIYSPNLIRARDGGILFGFMRQHSAVPPLTTQHLWKSNDEGATFVPHAEFGAGLEFRLCNAVVKRLRSGRLLLPGAIPESIGGNPYDHTYCGAALYSDDDGATWREAENRLYLPMRGVMEPHIEETRDGRVLMVMRNQLGSLLLAESRDEGITWSKPQASGLSTPESCPELTRIPATGDLLMMWNHSPYDPNFASHFGKRSPLTSAVSSDEGRTWEHFRDIEDDPGRAFSNPGCRFTGQGTAIVNYWTCEYTPQWYMQHVLDLRVAVLETAWFYGES